MNGHDYWVSLWDLDNCLSDDKWRVNKIDWHLEGNERYTRYDAEMGKDNVAHVGEWRLITQMSMPVFITGRRERWRQITRKWVSERLPVLRYGRLQWLHDPLILMRPDDCNDTPAVLKEKLLMQLPTHHGIMLPRVIAAFDDVDAIVEMYGRHGIPSTVLKVHDPGLAYTPADLKGET
jgi:hypothetical protein